MRKRIVRLVASNALIASLFTMATANAQSSTFMDTKGHWAEEAIQNMIQLNIATGYEDGTFKPDVTISRAEFVTMLSKALGLKPEVNTNQKWYQPFINAAVAAGIHRYEDFTQDVERPITRLEIARLVVRSIGNENKDSIATTDRYYAYRATETGLLQGLTGGQLGLDEISTRAQAVTVINRVLQLRSGGKLKVDRAALELADVALNGTNFRSKLDRASNIEFPYTVELGGINWTLHEVYLIDGNDTNSPFMQIVREEDAKYPHIKRNYDGQIITILKMTYDLGDGGRGDTVIADHYFSTGGNSIIKAFRKDETGIREGYQIYVESKKKYIRSGPYIQLSDWRTNEDHQLLTAYADEHPIPYKKEELLDAILKSVDSSWLEFSNRRMSPDFKGTWYVPGVEEINGKIYGGFLYRDSLNPSYSKLVASYTSKGVMPYVKIEDVLSANNEPNMENFKVAVNLMKIFGHKVDDSLINEFSEVAKTSITKDVQCEGYSVHIYKNNNQITVQFILQLDS
ncbi:MULTISPECIES: S-layer homology domain-containing protein [unclassified Paenibacillus]|uniref:S-layer homology domain-containing protein n=1 Tax=unclassified Paenibacillus TaxID=185978 RepID=UPI0027876B38|nr:MULTISPECIES: S-layer homology domain-containing protein [unclassified Paenibacillus]MDQ0896221.1 hypothetical protein [Paenibacillus sp. V4I7]MDQ0913963.1 hypothetical protein [Paenibacillus sp. V4I5]